MNNKQYFGLVALLILAIAFVFYWYDLRPKEIKRECLIMKQSTEKEIRAARAKYIKDNGPTLTDSQVKFIEETITGKVDEAYKQCLIEKGL